VISDIVFYHTVSYHGVLYRTISHRIIQYHTVESHHCHITHHTIILWHLKSYFITPYHTMASYIVLYPTESYSIIPWKAIIAISHITLSYCDIWNRILSHRIIPWRLISCCIPPNHTVSYRGIPYYHTDQYQYFEGRLMQHTPIVAQKEIPLADAVSCAYYLIFWPQFLRGFVCLQVESQYVVRSWPELLIQSTAFELILYTLTALNPLTPN